MADADNLAKLLRYQAARVPLRLGQNGSGKPTASRPRGFDEVPATTTETARELQRDPTNGGLELYDKLELVELAASVGIKEWTTMTKTELVEAIEKASRTTA
jgi:hypothetical protein